MEKLFSEKQNYPLITRANQKINFVRTRRQLKMRFLFADENFCVGTFNGL